MLLLNKFLLKMEVKKMIDPSHPPIIEDETLFVPSRGWAEMIKKVYQIDPLICPQCGARMRIISFIEDHKVIDKIINYLKLTFKAERPSPPQTQLNRQMRKDQNIYESPKL